MLKFGLLRLQLGGELLRLLKKSFGLHRSFDAVEYDADAGSQLLQKRELRSGEIAERSQFNDRFHLIFKQNR